MNWRELKEFCNSLHEELLDKQIIFKGKYEIITNIKSELSVEDYYVDKQFPDINILSESDVKSLIKEDPDSYPEGMNEFEKIIYKNCPILIE